MTRRRPSPPPPYLTTDKPSRRSRDMLSMLATLPDYPVTARMRRAAAACLNRHGCDDLAAMLGLEVVA